MDKAKQNRKELRQSRYISGILGWGIAAIFAVTPFYAPITVQLASHYNHFDLLRIWKEIALTLLGLIMAWFMLTHRRRAKSMLSDRLFASMIVYAAILVLVSIYDLISGRVSHSATVYGLMINLRLVGFFGVVYAAFRSSNLHKSFPWQKLILIPAALVVLFGALQATILPKDILRHIGYSKQTIVPYQTVDNRPDFARVQSTLRGPNPLGAYLAVIICLIFSLWLAAHSRSRLYLAIFGLLSFYVLFMTYSRSALVGTLLGLVVIMAIHERRFLARRSIFLLIPALVGLAVLVPLASRSYTLQNIFFHTSNKSTSNQSSNNARVQALRQGTEDVISHPLGGGVGSAGPASLRNLKNPPKIAESYFIQIGQEVGIIGLISFVVVNMLLIIRLYKQKDDPLVRALLASLIGLIFVNLVSHAWADDTLAYVWWGLAGIALSQTNYMAQPQPSIKK